MPPIKTAEDLKAAAQYGNFLNKSSSAFTKVNRFNQKLLQLQDKLKGENGQLSNQIGRFASSIMKLQLHENADPNALNDAITDVTLNLPNFLKYAKIGIAEERTGYQILQEEGKDIFSKEELDEAMTLIGKGLGVKDMGVDDPEKEKEKQKQKLEEQGREEEQQLLDQQAIIDAQANIALLDEEEDEPEKIEKPYTDKWLQEHIETLQKKETPFQNIRKELPPSNILRNGNIDDYLKRSAHQTVYHLRDLGALPTENETKPPVKNGIPTVFILRNGKVMTLEESGIAGFGTFKDNSWQGNPEFSKAVLRGEVYAYPAGEKYPVQLQGKITDNPAGMEVTHSAPVKTTVKLPKEPEITAEPRWYHRWFKFWGNNRKICDDYRDSVAAHNKWKQEVDGIAAEKGSPLTEQDWAASTIERELGAKRTKEVQQAELAEKYQRYAAKRQAEAQDLADRTKTQAEEIQSGINGALHIFAAKPQFKKEFSEGKRKLYNQEQFNRFTQADIDLSQHKIGGQAVTEEEFAALAFFGSLDAKLGVRTQETAPDKPGPMLEKLQTQEGYTQQQAERLVSKIIQNSYTVDLINTESRINNYIDTGINGGRKNAEEALKAYPQDKSKLASILADAVGEAAELAGVSKLDSVAIKGVTGTVRLSAKMLDLMERDPELKEAVKKQFEAQENELCAALNRGVEKYAPEHKDALKPRTFEECSRQIRNFVQFAEVRQKGLEAKQKLAEANANNQTLPEAQKKACIKDILKGNMVEALYESQFGERTDLSGPNEVNQGRMALEKYRTALKNKTIQIGMDEEGEDVEIRPDLPEEQILPKGIPDMVCYALNYRFTEKMPVVEMVTKPQEMEALDKQAEMIMQQDGLDQMDTERLTETLAARKDSPYTANNMILRTAKLKEKQPQVEEVLQQPVIGVNQPVIDNRQPQSII